MNARFTGSALVSRARGMASRAVKTVKRRTGGARAMVLMYHRIATPRVDPWDLAVSPVRFDEQVAALAAAFEVVSLADLAASRTPADPERPRVAVTFDDGYRDNLTEAQPVLSRYGCPATVFVATSFVGAARPYWWDALGETVMLGTVPEGEVLRTPAGDVVLSAGEGEAGRRELLHRLWDRLLDLEVAPRDAAMERLADLFDHEVVADHDALPMTEDEIRRLGRTVDIGAHTVNHLALSRFPEAVKRREIAGSRAEVARILGRPVVRFAYPYGAVDRATRIAAAAEGVEVAVSCEPDSFGAEHDPRAIPRIQVVEAWSGDELVRRIRTLVAA